MKKIFFTIIILTGFCNISNAQESYEESLARMMEVSGAQNSYKASINQMIIMYKQQKPNVPEEIWTEFENEMQLSLEELEARLVPVYKKYLTQEDLKQIIAFYESSAGKKLAENTPYIMRESMVIGQKWGEELGKRFAEKMKKKGY